MLQKSDLKQLDKFRAIGLSLIILAYAPGVFRESFWSDDYSILMETRVMAEHVLGDARPTLAAALLGSFSLLQNPAFGWILRTLALIALLLIFLNISRSLKNSSHYRIGIFSVAIAFCLPSFQMYIHWTNAWLFLWASLAGIYSFQLWNSNRISRKVIGVLLLALALTTYPPTALFYFSAITVVNVLNRSKASKFISDAIHGLTLLITSGLVSISFAFASIQIAGLSRNGRVKLITLSEIPDKIAWLLSRPLVIGLRPFTIDSPTPKIALITVLPILLILFLGIRRQSISSGEPFLYRASAIFIPLLLTLIPIMITSDNQIEFRLLSGYCWGILAIASFFLLIEIKSLISFLKISRSTEKTVLLLTYTLISFIAISTVNLHYSQLFGSPYQKKTAFLNSQISACFENGDVEKVLILPPKEPFPSFQRLGVFSMATDLASIWVPKSNVELLLKLRKLDRPVEYLEIRPTTSDLVRTECVIDLEEYRKLLT
jgi:hypothetical protein